MKKVLFLVVAIVAMALDLSGVVVAQERGNKGSFCKAPKQGLCPSQTDITYDAPAGLVGIEISVCGEEDDDAGVVIRCLCKDGEVIRFPNRDSVAPCATGMTPGNIQKYCLQDFVCKPTAKPTQKQDPIADDGDLPAASGDPILSAPTATNAPKEVLTAAQRKKLVNAFDQCLAKYGTACDPHQVGKKNDKPTATESPAPVEMVCENAVEKGGFQCEIHIQKNHTCQVIDECVSGLLGPFPLKHGRQCLSTIMCRPVVPAAAKKAKVKKVEQEEAGPEVPRKEVKVKKVEQEE